MSSPRFFQPPGRRPRRIDPVQIKHDVLIGLMGGIPLTVIARQNGVSQSLIAKWEKRDPTFAEDVAAARALGWDSLAAQCLEIADDRSDDVMYDAEGVPHPNTANVLSRKLMIETRLKLLSKWDSGRYGDAKTVKVEGEITATQRHVLDPRLLDEAGRESLRGLLEHAKAQGLMTDPEPEDAEFEDALGAEDDVPDG